MAMVTRRRKDTNPDRTGFRFIMFLRTALFACCALALLIVLPSAGIAAPGDIATVAGADA